MSKIVTKTCGECGHKHSGGQKCDICGKVDATGLADWFDVFESLEGDTDHWDCCSVECLSKALAELGRIDGAEHWRRVSVEATGDAVAMLQAALVGAGEAEEEAEPVVYEINTAQRIAQWRASSDRWPVSQAVTLIPTSEAATITVDVLQRFGVNMTDATHYAVNVSGQEVRVVVVAEPERFPPDSGPWLPLPHDGVIWRREV